MVDRVTLLEPAQDRDGVLHAGLADQHFLEAALQGGVLLDVLAVLVQRGRADAVQFAARERRLEHVAGVHRAFRFAGANHGVQLIDEQDHLALALGQVIQHTLQALLELAAKLGAGDQRAHVQRQQALSAQPFRHFVVDDALGQPFGDRGLAHTRLADQHRIVLGPALQDLDRATDFLIAADHRVKFSGLGPRGQIDGVLLQCLAQFFGSFRLHSLTPSHLVDGRLEAGFVGAGRFQGPAGLTTLLQCGQHEQLGGDKRIAPLLGVFVGEVEQARQVVADTDVARLAGHRWQLLHHLAQPLAQQWHVHAGLRQQRPGAAVRLVDQCHQQVHRLNNAVVATDRKRLRIGERLLETGRQLVHAHDVGSSQGRPARAAILHRCGSPPQGSSARRDYSGWPSAAGKRCSDNSPITAASAR